MASIMAEGEGGPERTKGERERGDGDGKKTGGSAAASFFFDEGVDDELATLMPALKKRFEAFDEDEGSLNFMGEIKMDNKKESFRHDADKENVASGRSSLPRRSFRNQNMVREGSGRVTTRRPIDYNKLFAMNKTLLSPPSGSLCMAKKKTMALKENVNKPAIQNVDDFREMEREKKISAVARRKLSGIKTPVQSKPQVVENRYARHARSRRAGGYERKLSKPPMKLDLAFYASKISEWDQECLAEEEVAPSTRAQSGTYVSTGRRRVLQANLSDLDQGLKQVEVQSDALGGAGPGHEIQSKEGFLRSGNEPNHPSVLLLKTDSPSSLPDMDCSAGESPLVEVQDLGKGKDGQNPEQDPGSVCPSLAVKTSFCGERDNIILQDPVGAEVIDGSLLRSLRRQCLREDAGSKKIIQQDPRPRDANLGEDTSLTPFRGFPVLETSNFRPLHMPVTSPTPPSNPVAVYLSLRRLEDVRQRRLDFISSPSRTNATSETGELGEEQETDFWEVQSANDMCRGDQFLTTTKEAVQDEQSLLREFESERDICDLEGDQTSASKRNVEAGDPPRCEESLSVASCHRGEEINDEVRTQQATVGRGEVDSPGNHLPDSGHGDDTPSRNNQILSIKACITPSGGNALLAICEDYPEDEDLDLPDVNESEPVPTKRNGTFPAQQPEPSRLAPNNEESIDEVAVPLFGDSVDEVAVVQTSAEAVNETGDREEPRVDRQHDCTPAQDEDSTTQTKPKVTKKRARKAKENRRFSLEGVPFLALASQRRCNLFTRHLTRDWKFSQDFPDYATIAVEKCWTGFTNFSNTTLADSGTVWKDGQRRSQRIRVRPLEWWRGEKLLYGRINKTLQTVIGIKYSSPGKYAAGIQEPFVVKSYVPDEYSALVKAAL